MSHKHRLAIQQLANTASLALSVIRPLGYMSLCEQLDKALREYTDTAAQDDKVDQSLIEMVKASYPADGDGVAYTDEEIAMYVRSAWSKGLSPNPADADCFPQRADGDMVVAANSYRQLMEGLTRRAQDMGWVMRPFSYRVIVEPHERDDLLLKNENDIGVEAILEFWDNQPNSKWYAAADSLVKSLSPSGPKNWDESIALRRQIEKYLGPAPGIIKYTYTGIGRFFEDERENDPVLKKFPRQTPKMRALNRAEKMAARKALPLGGDRMAGRTEIALEADQIAIEREKYLRGIRDDEIADAIVAPVVTPKAPEEVKKKNARNKKLLRGKDPDPNDLI